MIQNTERIRTQDLSVGQMLMEDIYLGDRKLIGEGSFVTNRIIEFLMKQNIKLVDIKMTPEKMANKVERENHSESITFSDQIDYFMLLGKLNVEFRYGKGIQQNDYIEYVIELFDAYMENLTCRLKLEQLKGYDYYTFLRAVDVFTLCTMFAREKNVPCLEKIALGFLFHDIGKLKSPKSILNKKTKLTRTEREIIQRHTLNGYQLLCDMGLESIAYLAMSHHENANGTGYPSGTSCLSLPIEIQLLQIVDVYSALTLQRSYKEPMHPSEAITLMYNNKQNFNEEILNAFTNFLGIFPENSIVLLSDGSQAIIESMDVPNPLLPKVRSFQGGNSFQIPYDFKLNICKMISYNEMSLERLFSKFSEALLSAEDILAKKYFEDLIEWYPSYEWYTHIHIPLFKIMKVLETNHLLSPAKIKKIKETYCHLMKDTMLKLNQINKQREIVLILIEEDVNEDELISLFEGILYSEEIYPIVIRKEKSHREIENIINTLNIKQLFVLSNKKLIEITDQTVDIFCVLMDQLEKFLITLSHKDLHKVQLKKQLQQYKYVRSTREN
ncbi:MAG: HD domain-containing phosphohydrolase [Solibacillus sp.]